jgi:radical SAM protein
MSGHPGRVDFSQAPFLAIWETTRSCGLACSHCRAEAILGRDPLELSTNEAKALIDDTAKMGTPIFILSGGDPLNRPDLETLITYGRSRGLRMGTIPAATENLTRERLQSLKDAGLTQIAFSLDGPTAELHDGFRGVPGAFAKTLQAATWAREMGLPLQINTVFAEWNYEHLDAMVELVRGLGIVFWEVFYLIPVGRGQNLKGLSPDQFESSFAKLNRLNDEEDFIIKLTEAPHYRRYVINKEKGSKDRITRAIARPRGVGGSVGQSPAAVNAGKGFVFIDHHGEVCPSGFLPIPVGNVRKEPLSEIYRNAPLMRDLRDPHKLKGKCGACEFAAVCSGSRARAWAMTGDYFATDPACAYVPAGYVPA